MSWGEGDVQATAPITAWEDELWNRLTGARGIDATEELGSPIEGDAYAIRTARGLALEGEVRLFGAPHDFAATVRNLGEAYLRLRIDETCFAAPGTDEREVNLWLSLYGMPESEVERLQSELDGTLGQALA